MIFIDGLGLGVDNPEINPLLEAEMPFIRRVLKGPLTKSVVEKGIAENGFLAKAIDAQLGVPGIPQSATGQTTLFSGVNAAKVAGRHINGFPTKVLRNILEKDSIFKQVKQAGLSGMFANTFTPEYFEAVRRGRWRHSATTTAALAGGVRLLIVEDLLKGYAVYQDLTNELLLQKNHQVPIITPETAAVNLIRQAKLNDFTLFEYFQTDHCGHAQDRELALKLLNRLDRFLAAVVRELPPGFTLVLTSDHGNIEDLSIKTHTLNPVPLMAFGKDSRAFEAVNSLSDVCPAILNLLEKSATDDLAIG